MNKSKLVSACVAGLLAAGGAMLPQEGMAATGRITYGNATELCQATDPNNFTGLRFRVQGVYNSSDASIQVACTLTREFNADNSGSDIDIFVHNFRTSTANINCSVLGGSRYHGAMNVTPVSWSVPGQSTSIGFVGNIDVVNESYSHYSISCIIPPKMELGLIRLYETDAADGL